MLATLIWAAVSTAVALAVVVIEVPAGAVAVVDAVAVVVGISVAAAATFAVGCLGYPLSWHTLTPSSLSRVVVVAATSIVELAK